MRTIPTQVFLLLLQSLINTLWFSKSAPVACHLSCTVLGARVNRRYLDRTPVGCLHRQLLGKAASGRCCDGEVQSNAETPRVSRSSSVVSERRGCVYCPCLHSSVRRVSWDIRILIFILAGLVFSVKTFLLSHIRTVVMPV